MLNVYYANIQEFNFTELLKASSAIISKERKNQIEMLKFEADKKRALIAELLILNVLVCDCSFLISEIKFLKMETGKPYLANSDIQFNLSHSGDYVICGVSTRCLGIDIEEYGESHQDLIHYFHPVEIREYNSLSVSQRKNFFYNYWSLKESYVKYLGLGLSCQLDSFYLIKEKETYSVVKEERKEADIIIEMLAIDSQYACSICYEAERIDQVKKVNRENLNDFMTKVIVPGT